MSVRFKNTLVAFLKLLFSCDERYIALLPLFTLSLDDIYFSDKLKY
jgi:hypothetical protein